MKKILIVEDEKQLIDALVKKFSRLDFTVFKAVDGEEGLRIALSEKPDIILLDLVMPRMDGMTMLKKLRSDEWGKSVPVIILTNKQADDEINQQIIQNQPSFYLIKSNQSLAEITDKVNEVLNL